MLTRKDAIASEYFQRYISIAPDDDLLTALQENTKRFRKLLKKIPRKKIDFAYADGKWTVREMVQHIIDAERVFAYRALTFARKDKNKLPGFEENEWAAESKAKERKWKDLLNEFDFLRAATLYLFASFDDDQLKGEGVASNNNCNVLGLGFIAAGHVEHHMKILKERYL